MKRSLLLSIPFLTASLAFAQSVPNAISYQGRVADASGVPIGDTAPVNRKVTLRVYDSATATNPIFSEEQTVTINKGVFSVLLGQGLAVVGEPHNLTLSDVFNAAAGSERFLGVTVDDGGAAPDPEITPRQQIVTTAYAMRAKVAESANAAIAAQSAVTATTAATANSVQQAAGTSNMDWLNVNNFTVNGHSKIQGNNVLEFGIGLTKGNGNGTIGYNALGTGALDIVGAGTGLNDRRVVVHAQGGTEFLGPVSIPNGPLSFGSRLGQHINLWGTGYGIGIQGGTLYSRVDSGGQFIWYRGGVHNENAGNAGSGGIYLAKLDHTGLYLPSGPVDRSVHGVFAQSYGGGHSFGSQNYTTYIRTAGSNPDNDAGDGAIAFYAGGNFTSPGSGRVIDAGGGRTMAYLTSKGLRIMGNKFGNEESNAGIIGYKTFSDFALDIVGAGPPSGGGRSVKIWAESGTEFTGPIILDNANRWGGGAYYAFGGDADNYGNAGVQNVNNQGANNVVLSAIGGRIVASSFTATSDERLKTLIGPSDSAHDLATLMKVQVSDYTLKDDMAKKPTPHKKVVAQQVEKVFPQAVSTTQGVVPDLLTPVTAKAGFVALAKPLPAAVKKGDRLKVVGTNPRSGTLDSLFVKVTDANKEGFQLDEKLEGKVFLHGHQVDDLRSVDYEAIAMLNVSATQELNNVIDAQKARIKTLEEANAALEKELAAAKDVNTQQDVRLAAIEKAMKLTADTPPAPKKAASAKVATIRR